MPLTVNGQPTPIPDPPTLERLLAVLRPPLPCAVARNEEFVPASVYAKCELTDSDPIEIVYPSAGG